MPKLDGPETTRRIRQRPEGSPDRLTILALGADESAAERCLEAGMDGVVGPPVSIQGLRSAIETFAATSGSR